MLHVLGVVYYHEMLEVGMELIESIQSRRSIRAFRPTPVPQDTLKKVLTLAGRSPSYANTQPWEVAVVTGGRRNALGKILKDLASSGAPPNPDIPSPQRWPEVIAQRLKEHGAKRFRTLGIDRANQEQREQLRLANYEFYGAPCVLFLFIDSSLSTWSIFDMGLFAQNILLISHSLGLGSCLQAILVNYPQAVRTFLGLPSTKLLVIGISIGYLDEEALINTYRSDRINPDDFVFWYD